MKWNTSLSVGVYTLCTLVSTLCTLSVEYSGPQFPHQDTPLIATNYFKQL